MQSNNSSAFNICTNGAVVLGKATAPFVYGKCPLHKLVSPSLHDGLSLSDRQERRRHTVRLIPTTANATTARIMLDTAEPVAAIESLFDASWSGFVPSASPG